MTAPTGERFNHAAIPCRSCRRLRSFDLEKQNQKIAACGSSYIGDPGYLRLPLRNCFSRSLRGLPSTSSGAPSSSTSP
ncbi:hypothetical protein PkP19E3_06200 [Pseudomonas koreensis]|nr:hypothetical protein PkP19E3_06200 [Pseudomonas koreensis]